MVRLCKFAKFSIHEINSISALYTSVWTKSDPSDLLYKAITKQLKSNAETSHTCATHTLQAKSLPLPPENWGKYSITNIGQIAVYIFILNT